MGKPVGLAAAEWLLIPLISMLAFVAPTALMETLRSSISNSVAMAVDNDSDSDVGVDIDIGLDHRINVDMGSGCWLGL